MGGQRHRSTRLPMGFAASRQLALWDGDTPRPSRCYEEAIASCSGARRTRPADQCARQRFARRTLPRGDAARGACRLGARHGIHRAHDLTDTPGHHRDRGLVAAQPGAACQRQASGGAPGAGDRVPVPGRAHQQAERRGTAPQLPEQARSQPRDRRGVARSTSPAGARSARRTWRASRRCASRSSGWWTPACA